MENLDFEWTVESSNLHEFKSEYIVDEDENFEINANSPDISAESEDEKSDVTNSKDELQCNLNKLKNVALAKKRLQAYSKKAHVKHPLPKPEKNDENQEPDKTLPRKTKKDYPDDRAKAVIQEIEEIKRREVKTNPVIPQPLNNDQVSREIAMENIKRLVKLARETSRSPSPGGFICESNVYDESFIPLSELMSSDEYEDDVEQFEDEAEEDEDRDKHFKKREIKSRNYRRTDSYSRRSNSPDDRSRRSRKSSSIKKSYPKNWAEYNEEKLTIIKDKELKAKFFNQKTNSNVELYHKLYNLEGPPSVLEPFKYSTETESREVPFSHFRVTRCHPKISYSVNYAGVKETFISRLQLFQIIPTHRKQLIEKFINSAGKCHSPAKPLQTRNWYSRTWKKTEAECKVLENSVGLSFLQTYSDEEEEIDNEEIVICSHTKTNKKKEEPNMTLSDIKEIQEKIEAKDRISEENEEDTQVTQVDEPKDDLTVEDLKEDDLKEDYLKEEDLIEDDIQIDTTINDTKIEETTEAKSDEEEDKCEPGEILDDSQSFNEDDREYTPEKELLIPKLMKEEDILKTKKAIKMLEKELAKRNEINLVEVVDKKEKSRSRKESETKDKGEKRKEGKKKKKKKSEKVEKEKAESESDEEKKSKKKKKKKSKKKEISEEEESSEEEKKIKRAKKKDKKDKKKEKVKNKINKKETPNKESKSKTKEESSEEENTKRDKKKKKKKIADSSNQKNEKESKKKNKKTVKKKRDSSEEPSSSDEKEEKHVKKEKNKKKLKKNKKEKDLEDDVSSKTSEDKRKIVDFEEKHRKSDESRKSGSRRNSHGSQVEYIDLRQKLVAKSSKVKEDKPIEEPKNISYKDDLRWELLERKRQEEEFEDFPLEKETYSPPKEIEAKTPDTDEYSGNWEKESDAVWESEEEQPPKPVEKSNSWESDEETVERTRGTCDITSFKDSLDLELPLNIKPFKRRSEPCVDADMELEKLMIEGKNLSEERRLLEIEKLKVKELDDLERRVRKHLSKDTFEEFEDELSQEPNKSLDVSRQILDEFEANTSNKDTPTDDVIEKPKNNIVIDLDKIQEKAKMEISKPKRDRWDQRIPTCSTPIKNVVDLTETTPERKDNDEVVFISSSSEVQDTSAVLENEYEQFIKAVSSNEQEKKETPNVSAPIKEAKPSMISPKDIPFIPMPNENIPAPVPSPKLDVPKSINISLSTNITLGFSSKIDSPSTQSLNLVSSPIPTAQLTPISKTEALVTSSTVDIKPQLIKNENGKPEKLSNIQSLAKLEMSKLDFQIGSPLNDKPNLDKTAKEMNDIESDKPLIFGGMTLPTKKSLLDNSNLKLGDSDEEEKIIKMKPFEEIKKEANTTEEESTVQESLEPQPEEKKPVEVIQKEIVQDQTPKRMRSRSPHSKNVDNRSAKREISPKRPGRYSSPSRSRRNESPARRRSSPGRRRSPRRRSPCKRSPDRARRSPGRKSPCRRSPIGKRRYSSRRSNSPTHRKRRSSMSPRRRSPRRSNSPRASASKRMRSRSPEKPHSSWKSPERDRSSHVSVASPLERLKRSVADSTISDDLLPQPSHNQDEYLDSPAFYERSMKRSEPSMNPSSDVDYMKEPQKIMTHTTYNSYSYDQNHPYTDLEQYMNPEKQDLNVFQTSISQNSFVQIGNMVEIVPSDLNLKTDLEGRNISQRSKTVTHQEKSQIVQVGNIVQIVPTEFTPEMMKQSQPYLQKSPPSKPPVAPVVLPVPPSLPKAPSALPAVPSVLPAVASALPAVLAALPAVRAALPVVQPALPAVPSALPALPSALPPIPPEPKPKKKTLALPPVYPPLPDEEKEEKVKPTSQEKQSAEETMQVKIAERKAEREQRRLEKEKKRLEKEKRRKEREMKRQVKMKQKTEIMIKRALQLEVAAMAEGETSIDTSTQWTPNTSFSGSTKDVGKSILMKGGFSTTNSTKADKVVKFADGVRPGEGTSPSGGEELSSPPPKKILPKEKRYTKTKLKNKSQKKKVKVKIIKKSLAPSTSELDADDDEEDNLPPPSPPPGSPPPHLFPPRVKPTILNNIHPSFVMAVPPLPPLPPVPTVSTAQQPIPFVAQQLQLHPQQQQLHALAQQLHPQAQQLHPQAPQLHPQAQQLHPQAQQLHPQAQQLHPQAQQLHPQAQQLHPQAQQLHPQQQLYNPGVSLLLAPPPPPPHHHAGTPTTPHLHHPPLPISPLHGPPMPPSHHASHLPSGLAVPHHGPPPLPGPPLLPHRSYHY